MAYVPDDVPQTPEARRTFLRRQKGMAGYEALKNHYQQAMSELHYVPEVQLLERALAALGDNSTKPEVLKPSTTNTRHYSFPKHFFRIVSVCWAILQKFLKGKSDAYK